MNRNIASLSCVIFIFAVPIASAGHHEWVASETPKHEPYLFYEFNNESLVYDLDAGEYYVAHWLPGAISTSGHRSVYAGDRLVLDGNMGPYGASHVELQNPEQIRIDLEGSGMIGIMAPDFLAPNQIGGSRHVEVEVDTIAWAFGVERDQTYLCINSTEAMSITVYARGENGFGVADQAEDVMELEGRYKTWAPAFVFIGQGQSGKVRTTVSEHPCGTQSVANPDMENSSFLTAPIMFLSVFGGMMWIAERRKRIDTRKGIHRLQKEKDWEREPNDDHVSLTER